MDKVLVTGGNGFTPAQLLTAKRIPSCYCSASYAGRADLDAFNISGGCDV